MEVDQPFFELKDAYHREVDKRYGQEALGLIIDNNHSREQQDSALKAAREGARHVFSLHGDAAKKHLNSIDTVNIA